MTRSAKALLIRKLTLLGATGSIGDSTLDVVARHPERFTVTALAAHSNAVKLADLCRRFRPAYAALSDPRRRARSCSEQLAREGVPTRVLAGAEGLAEVASLPEVDTVLAAIVGAAGLAPTLAAVRAGKRILLANKEALVMGGALFMAAVDAGGATLLPIDSEHNAIFQCLPAHYAREPQRCRRAADPADRVRRSLPHAAARRIGRGSRPTRRARIPTGRWVARSRSIRRR